MSVASVLRTALPRAAPKCMACGRAITDDDEVVAVAGGQLHADCALYQPRGSR